MNRLSNAQLAAVEAFRKHGGVRAAAEALGMDRRGLQRLLRRAEVVQPGCTSVGSARSDDSPPHEPIDRPVEEVLAERVARITRRSEESIETPVVGCPSGPFVVWHCTDEHLDDNGSRIDALADDMGAARRLSASRLCGGDILNNWPLGGRLAGKWAEQEATLPEGLALAKWSLNHYPPDVYAFGNHEKMNAYLKEWLLEVMPRRTVVGWWSVRFVYRPAQGRSFVVTLAHDFSQGKSWFHPLHGHIREDLESGSSDIYLAGHLHCEGSMAFTNAKTGRRPLFCRSRGYKQFDGFATQIGKGGNAGGGHSTWLVLDPREDCDERAMFAFADWRGAEAMLNGLVNLQAV